ncbi:MAG: DUF6370 family protein [Bacteroidota bacterium]
MKAVAILLFCSLSMFSAICQTGKQKKAIPDPSKPVQVVEAACGECKFGLTGKSCDLAVRINGKAYFVDSTTIDSHGDAHAKDGFCNAVRKAEVQGDIVNERFVASYFKLLPVKKEKKNP